MAGNGTGNRAGNGSSGAFIGGVIVGAAVGAIAGLLAAPKQGKETRKLIQESADALPELLDDVSDTVQFHAERWTEVGLNKWDRTLLRLRTAITTGLDVGKEERRRLERPQRTVSEGDDQT